MSPLDCHTVSVLQFSGGKDSLACLYSMERDWHRIIVAWVNTGDAFPETIEQMAYIRGMVPHFKEVRSHQPAQIVEHGWPVDMLPVTRTAYGRHVDGHEAPLMQPYASCCAANLWLPMQDAMREMGATLLIRGTRLSDARKSMIRSGAVVDGVEYYHPIEDWSDAEVRSFLGDRLPAHYATTETSLDCKLCTAYLYENKGKMRYMAQHHPYAHTEVMRRLSDIRAVAEAELTHIRTAMEAAA